VYLYRYRGFESLPLRFMTYEPIIYVASHPGGTWLFLGSIGLA